MAAFGKLSQALLRSGLVQTRRQLSATAGHEGQAKKWKMLTFFVAFPCLGLCFVSVYLKEQQHSHEQPEFVPYSHLRLRSKRFPWGDGNHSLFHNAHLNALPAGYEGHDE